MSNQSQLSMDQVANKSPVSLPSDFMVWLASPEAKFLNGRYVWANWDVEEILEKKEEIESSPTLLTLTLKGLYQP